MLKYAKIDSDILKTCIIATGDDEEYYKLNGFTMQEVEQGYDHNWYLKGYAPSVPLAELEKKKRQERDDAINSIMWRVERYQTQKVAEIPTTDTKEDYFLMLNYLQYLRNIPADPKFPYVRILPFEIWKK